MSELRNGQALGFSVGGFRAVFAGADQGEQAGSGDVRLTGPAPASPVVSGLSAPPGLPADSVAD